MNNYFHKIIIFWEIATNTIFLIRHFIYTLTNFTIKILIDKIQLYPWIIKPKLLYFSPNSKPESSPD